MRLAQLPQDRVAVHDVLRRCMRDRPQVYAAHPGDLDWWWYHADPRQPATATLLTDDTVVHVHPGEREVSVFGRPELVDVGIAMLGDGPVEIGGVADSDVEQQAALRRRGFAPSDVSMPTFEHDLAAPADVEPPNGWMVRAIDPLAMSQSRADAARSSFRSSMEPEVHRARYRAFQASPCYQPECDLVAVDGHGTVGAFAIWWPDAETGIAQLEPLGTHQDHHRKGLATAVMRRVLIDAAAAGMSVLRVITDDGTGAEEFYESVGFRRTGTLRWWHRD
jgi:predicted N-acetyltransferase YhbS